MDKQEAINILDEMIEAIPKDNKDITEFWCSTEIYSALDIKEYKQFKIYTSNLIPLDTIYGGKMYF